MHRRLVIAVVILLGAFVAITRATIQPTMDVSTTPVDTGTNSSEPTTSFFDTGTPSSSSTNDSTTASPTPSDTSSSFTPTLTSDSSTPSLTSTVQTSSTTATSTSTMTSSPGSTVEVTSPLDTVTAPPDTNANTFLGTFLTDTSQSTITTGALGASLSYNPIKCPGNPKPCCGFDVCNPYNGQCVCPSGWTGGDCCTPVQTTTVPSDTPKVQTGMQIVNDADVVNGFSLSPIVGAPGSTSQNGQSVDSLRISLSTSSLEEIAFDTGAVVRREEMDASKATKEAYAVYYRLTNGAEARLTYQFFNGTNAVRFGNRSTVVKSEVGFCQSNMSVTKWQFANPQNKLRFTYSVATKLELYGIGEVQDDTQGLYRLFRWRSASGSSIIMGVFIFVIVDGSKTAPMTLTYKVINGEIRVTMLLPSFTTELLVDPDISYLLGDQDIPRGKKKSNIGLIAGVTVGGVILIVAVIVLVLYVYSRTHKQSFLFHSDKNSDVGTL